MPDLDRDLEVERAAVDRAAVALLRLAQVGEARLEVAPRLHAAEVHAVLVRAGDELALAQHLVGDHFAGEADGAERAAARTERGADLLVGGRPRVAGDRVVQLHLAQAVVAAHEREDEGAVRLRHRHRLRRRRQVDPEEVGERLARRHSGRRHLLRRDERLRERHRARHRLRDVAVGGVVAVLAADENVLARARRREEVDAELAAHDPALRQDVVRLQLAAGEDRLVRLAVRLEALLDAFLVAVEGVRVLHDELADAE